MRNLRLFVLSGAFWLAGTMPLWSQNLDEINAWVKQIQALESKGELIEAAAEYERMLSVVEQRFGRDSEAASDVLHMVALAYVKLGRHAESEPIFLRSLRLKEQVHGTDQLVVTGRLSNLASVYKQMGRYAEAEKLALRVLRIREAHLPADHGDIAVSLNNLANLYNQQWRFTEAEPLYQRAMQIWEVKLGTDSPEFATVLHNIGAFYNNQERYPEARKYLDLALAIREGVLDANHPDIGLTLLNLAINCFHTQQYDTAKQSAQRSLQIHEQRLGPMHPNVAESLSILGYIYQSEGDFAQALADYERAIEITDKSFGQSHPLYAQALLNLSGLYVRQSNWAAAVDAMDRSRQSSRRHIGEVLPLLTESQQRDFLETDKRKFSAALSLGLMKQELREVVERSAGWLLNAKGVGHAALVQRILMTRDLPNPQLKSVANDLITVRRQLAELSMSVPAKELAATQQSQVNRLTAQEQSLMRRLADAAPPVRSKPDWVEIAEIRRSIPRDSVFIDIGRFDSIDLLSKRGTKTDRGPARYAAWITPAEGQGEISIVDLGLADEIDAAILQLREGVAKAAQADSLLRNEGETAAEQQYRVDAKRVMDLIWSPISAKLGSSAKRLIVSPDGTLWLLPWSALPIADDKYLIEAYSLLFIVSGRELVPRHASELQMTQPCIFADPDYDLSPQETLQSIQAIFPNRRSLGDQTRGFAFKSSALPDVARLPNTAVEAQLVSPNIQRLLKADPQAYTDRYALESVVKEIRRPQLLLLSTHGFFLPDQYTSTSANQLSGGETGDRSNSVRPLENPLLRCGLLFAGCNGKQGIDGDDGILTGMEIVGIDLRGSDLVVLSACETGLGEIRNGEGVAGLRQAFQLAGAKSVAATLWQVPDRDSAMIMNDFFAELGQGTAKEESLRQSQIKRLKVRRERYGAAHPFFWAAWTLTGQ